jgi:hypothetical protein
VSSGYRHCWTATAGRIASCSQRLDTEHDDPVVLLVDLVGDAERAAPGGVGAFQFPLQFLADTIRVA